MEEIRNRLAQIGNCKIKIVSTSEIEINAKLITFEYDEYMKSAAIVYNTGELFHLKDWQGGYPANAGEIEDFD